MMWIRRIAAVPLLLVAFIGGVGLMKSISHRIEDPVGNGIFSAILMLVTLCGAFLLLRPDVERLRGLSLLQVRHWFYTNPLGQAIALYILAAVLMAAYPDGQIIPGVIAACVYSLAAPWTAARQRHWWSYAGLALLGFCLLLFLLAGTADALAPRGFGEVGMLFVLPLEGFPILLIISGIVRIVRGERET